MSFSLDSIQNGPVLPEASSGHCLVDLGSGKIMAIGGSFYEKTHIYDWNKHTWDEGPELNVGERDSLGCGRLKDKSTGKL